MSAAERQILRADILPWEQYAAERQARRARAMDLKRARRVEVPGSGHSWPAGEMADALDRLLRADLS